MMNSKKHQYLPWYSWNIGFREYNTNFIIIRQPFRGLKWRCLTLPLQGVSRVLISYVNLNWLWQSSLLSRIQWETEGNQYFCVMFSACAQMHKELQAHCDLPTEINSRIYSVLSNDLCVLLVLKWHLIFFNGIRTEKEEEEKG